MGAAARLWVSPRFEPFLFLLVLSAAVGVRDIAVELVFAAVAAGAAAALIATFLGGGRPPCLTPVAGGMFLGFEILLLLALLRCHVSGAEYRFVVREVL